ncbi:MAG: putative MYND domain protein [Linnemannia elongata]|nr:MAG: putative MYND domain protein [Linnemannia elongata]
MTAKCAKCSKTAADAGTSLKVCSKCKSIHYCSRECQKDHWKVHKKDCATNANANTGATFSTSSARQEVISKGLKKHIDKPYHRLNSKTWLHDRPEEDVYKLLIDCFRMRQHDDFTTEGLKDKDGLYGGASHSHAGFKRFLVKAEARQDLLPHWWFMGKAAANCLRMGGGLGATGTEWSSLSRKVDKAAIIDHYANPEMPMQLRMLGEQVYLRGPAGQSGVPMIKLKIESEGMYDMIVDMTRLTPK